MNLDKNNWPYHWFGFWKEYGDSYINCPSIFNFIDKEENQKYDKEKLVKYLANSQILVATSAINFPNIFTNEKKWGSICYRTNGELIWLENICELILFNNIVIPCEWYSKIKKSNYEIKAIPDEILYKIELPKLGKISD